MIYYYIYYITWNKPGNSAETAFYTTSASSGGIS